MMDKKMATSVVVAMDISMVDVMVVWKEVLMVE